MLQQYLDPELECADADFMRQVQCERLKKMVSNAYENVPLYRQKMDELGVSPHDITDIDDLQKLPFTVKDDLRNTYPFGMFAVPKERLVRIHASSGTTGKQTVVGYTQHDIEVWARSVARALISIGTTKSDSVHVSYGYGLFTGGLGLHYGAEYMGATAIPVSSGNTARQVQILQDYGSNILCCTPSYAMYIGETAREMGIDAKKLPLRAGFFGAEPWTEQMRAEIEEILQMKAYDIAGPGVGFECPAQQGMHINEDYFYPEIVDPDTGAVLPDGQYGELVFTCIGKEALPLIRYRTRDICKLERGKCACGRTLVKMCKPHGRTDDMLIIRGINVFPSQVESVLLSLHMDPNYRIVVDRAKHTDTLEVQVEMTAAMFQDALKSTAEVEKSIAVALQSTLNISAKVRLLEPKSIPRSEGKAKRVIDRREFT